MNDVYGLDVYKRPSQTQLGETTYNMLVTLMHTQ
jgi:hypothetical protein